MIYKFTARAEKAIEIANEAALELGHNYIGTEHLLYGLAKEGTGVASKVIENQDVTADDISRTVIKVTERIDINKFVAFTHRNSHGYDGLMMLRLLLLAFADNGYASTRKLAELCRTDIRYMFIAQNQKPSHQAFQRFIHDALIMSVEEIFYEMNRIMDDELPIDTDVLCIDGTKYEANANKNTFIWRKNTVRHREI